MEIVVTVTLTTETPNKVGVSPCDLAKTTADLVKENLPWYYTGATWHVADAAKRPRRLRLTNKGERWMLALIGYGTATVLFVGTLAAIGLAGWIQGH